MKFDWITFGIWLSGFIILVIWIIKSIKEIRDIFLQQKKEFTQK